ncbi:uncharacterized protein [Temnothorax longispinosus]|uniref:uncharacterized protein n=1 Tax=Temnothorax longispinosus TaxID=300112 RepID=UPI003A9976D5
MLMRPPRPASYAFVLNTHSKKKNRSTRTTAIQYEELVKYMETHSDFASCKYVSKEGKVHHAQQWENVAAMLNALSKGPGKTVKQWQTVWRDLKSNTSKKASKLRNERNRTGNFPVTSEPLDSLEQRVLGCIGLEYVEGTPDCPDSIPEEEELQVQLENGNEDVLLLPPSTTTVGSLLNTSTRELENNGEKIINK